ncbi:Proton-coupled folate transporter [Nymphon striatum]|nr:Proton-coupled folate transporter [Nymphon striatum]
MSSGEREDPKVSGMPTSKNKERTRENFPLVTAEITLFLYSLIKFCVTPAAKNLLLTKACYEKFSDMEYCLNTSNTDIGKDDYVQDRIATYNIYGSLGYFLPAGIAAIFVGSWGDKFGRKFPLLIPPFGIVIRARNLLYLFVKDAPLSWTYSEYTTLLAVISGSMAFTMLIALPLMNVFFSFKDTSVAILASVFEMFYYCVLGFATTTEFIYIASSFTIISSLTSTSFRSILSKFVDSDEEGKLFSVMAVIENVGFMVSVAVFNSIWPFTRKIFRGLLFESAGVMALFYIAIATYLHLKLKLVEKPASNCELVSVNSTIKGNSSHHHE